MLIAWGGNKNHNSAGRSNTLAIIEFVMTHRFFIIILLYLTVNLFSGSEACAASVLKTINRNDESARIQVSFHFDQLPAYKVATSGRRVDLEFANTAPADDLKPPGTDSRMIKLVTRIEQTSTLVSLYFRYPPQQVNANSSKETGLLMLDILLGNQLSASSPEISSKLQGVTVVKRTSNDALNPVNASVFANKWRSFFSDYESQVEIAASPHFHLPPFPLAASLPPSSPPENWLPREMQAMAQEGKWLQFCQLLREQMNKQLEEKVKERLVLTYGESLVRAGEYREPYFLLQRILVQYPNALMADLANLLLIYLQASRGDYVNAYYELLSFRKTIGETPFISSLHLLEAEMALMANHVTEAERLLDDPLITTDTSLAPVRQLRRADLLAARNEKADALRAYLDLSNRSPLVESDPMSLARFADALYVAQRYAEAAKRYQTLSDLLTNRPGLDLVLFRQAMAQLHVPAMAKRSRLDLQQIHEAFPETEGGVRATLKQTDLDYISNRLKPHEAETVYGTFAVTAESIILREESAFKQALVNALSGEGEKSVNQCMQLLRGFQAGKLRTEATALLIQQLPGVIRQLVKNEEHIKALVLAKQNKHLFVQGWLDIGLLYDLARAYSKLGMADQASQSYQYLFEISDETNKENIYLPLIKELFTSHFFLQVEEYANRYQLRYPKGKDLAAIHLYKVQAVYANGQHDKALALITASSSPRLRELEVLKGRIYFENREWQKVIDTLTQPDIQPNLPQYAVLWLAESYFQADMAALAEPLFQQVRAQNRTSEQALFRLAQISVKQDKATQALKQFKELADKGSDPLWTKLAREEAAILELAKRENKPPSS